MPDTTYSVAELRTQLGCTICGKRVFARRMCNSHYHRWYRYGDPLKGGTDWGAAQRWLEAALTYEGDGCLAWPFAATKGHGVIRVNDVLVQAHRELLVRATGENPPEMEACHNCGSGLCCNIAHLRWDTHAGNMADTIRHGTSTRGEKHGHHILKEPEVRQIKAALERGDETQTSIAKRYGVHLVTINSIKHGRTWGWLK